MPTTIAMSSLQFETASPFVNLRVAIVHEWLTAFAGSERVVEQLLEIFPRADLFCLVDYLPQNERAFLRGRRVKTSFLQRLPWGKTLFRKLLWLLPSAIESFDMSEYDLILSSSHAVAKGVITGPEQVHICYCHSPMRYAWDLQHEYLRQAGLTHGVMSLYARASLHYLRMWDVRTSNGVDCFVANSRFIAGRIKKVYRRESLVIHPPVDLKAFRLETDKQDYYITVSRLVPYKRVDLIVEAFSRTPWRKLVIIGDGPMLNSCKERAGSNIEFLGYQPDEVVRDRVAKAKAFVFAAEEDFGITLVEAQASGTPVICFGRGGALDSVIDGETGVFFEQQTVDSILPVLDNFEARQHQFDPTIIRAHAKAFSQEKFRSKFATLASTMLKKSSEDRQGAYGYLDRDSSVKEMAYEAILDSSVAFTRPSLS